MSKEEKTKEDLEKLCEALVGIPGAVKIAKDALEYIEQLESNLKKSGEKGDKYLQKLVDALVVKKDLSPEKNNEFKKIIADNIDLTTLELRIKLTEEF